MHRAWVTRQRPDAKSADNPNAVRITFAEGMAMARAAVCVADFDDTPEGVALNAAFEKIDDSERRRRIIELVEAIASLEEGGSEERGAAGSYRML